MKIPTTPVVERAGEVRPKGTPARAYEVICVSLYRRDLDSADDMVAELKQRGFASANRSRLIRIALSRLTVDDALAILEGARL